MAIYTSNINRVTGLSGIDTESMIDQMMKAESTKYNRLEKQKTTVTWQQEAYRQLITSIENFQNKWFSTSSVSNNIGYDAFWNNYSTSIKDSSTGIDSNVITVNSTTNSGKYNINIIQKAETESITGGSVVSEISTDKTAAQIEQSINNYGEINLEINLDGATKEISVTQSDLLGGKNLEDVLNDKLQSAFGSTNGKGKVTVSKDSSGKLTFSPTGDGHTLTIADGSERKTGVSFTQTGALASSVNNFEITIDGYTAKVTFDSSDNADKRLEKIQSALKEAQNTTGDKKDLSSYVSVSKSGTEDLVIKNESKDTETNVSIKVDGTNNTQKLNPTGNLGLMGIKNSTTKVDLTSKLSNVFGDEFNKLFSGNNDEITLKFGGKDVTVNKDDTIQSLINKVNSSDGGVKLSFNEVTNRFSLESTQSGSNGDIQISDIATQNFLRNITKIDVQNKSNSLNSKYTKGQDAIFEIDGVQTTRSSNDINMNGISFTINGTGKVTLEAKNDVDGTVKKIKEFVEDYNKLIQEINTAITDTRPKSGEYGYYEPLTDDEKKAMSEDEIKKWEEKAKTGLLNGDEHLNKFLSSLRGNVYKAVDIGGKSISLYEIGINTSKNYNSGGQLEINEEKLKKAIEERGDEIKQLFTNEKGIAKNIQNSIDDAIGSKGYLRQKAGIKGTISATNNDLTKELEDIAKKLAEERERLYNKEMQYFNMFAKMEAAMNQQNNQMAAILGMTGQ